APAYFCLPIWSPMTPPMAAPPTVPRMSPLLITAPATPPTAAPVVALFSREDMLSQVAQPVSANVMSRAGMRVRVPVFMVASLSGCGAAAVVERRGFDDHFALHATPAGCVEYERDSGMKIPWRGVELFLRLARVQTHPGADISRPACPRVAPRRRTARP